MEDAGVLVWVALVSLLVARMTFYNGLVFGSKGKR
jgi:hypothetical protein